MSPAPKVFLDYDQAALDRAYDQPSWAPNMQEVLARRGAAADAVRARLGQPQRFAYKPNLSFWGPAEIRVHW